MYNKNRINTLFRGYVSQKDTTFLAELIQELNPMIDVCLSRWPIYKSFWGDAKQEIKLRLWRNLQNFNIDRSRQLINPSAYLFFLLRTYCTRILTRLPDTQMISLDEVLTQRSESTY